MKRKTGWILAACLVAVACVVWAVRTGESRSAAEQRGAKRTLRLMTYNYNNGEWAKFCKDKDNLNYAS